MNHEDATDLKPRVTYAVLSYAPSNLSVVDTPLAIIQLHQSKDSSSLRGFESVTWRASIIDSSTESFREIEELIETVRAAAQFDSAGQQNFYNSIKDLNLGPIRTTLVGSCLPDLVDNLLALHLSTTSPYLTWPDSFIEIH